MHCTLFGLLPDYYLRIAADDQQAEVMHLALWLMDVRRAEFLEEMFYRD